MLAIAVEVVSSSICLDSVLIMRASIFLVNIPAIITWQNIMCANASEVPSLVVCLFHHLSLSLFLCNSRSKCSDTSYVFGWYWNMHGNTQAYRLQWIQYDRLIDTAMCGCTTREYRHSKNVSDTRNAKAESLRVFKWIDSWHLSIAISSNQRRLKHDQFVTAKSSIAFIQTAC